GPDNSIIADAAKSAVDLSQRPARVPQNQKKARPLSRALSVCYRSSLPDGRRELLDRDLLRVDLGKLRQRQLQHTVDMLRHGCVAVDGFRQTDRSACLTVAALFPQRLAVGFDLFARLDTDGDVSIFDLDFDLVLRDAGKLRLDDVCFGRLDHVEGDAAAV